MLTSVPLPPCEGIGFYVWNLSRYLMRQGHQVQIITRGQVAATTRQVVDGIPIWRPPFFPCYPLHVHLHALFVGRLLGHLSPEIDLLHLHTPLIGPVKADLPVLVTVHTPMKADAASVQNNVLLGLLVRLQSPISVHLERRLLARVDKITAVARSVAAELGEYGVNPNEVVVMGNGADTELFSPAAVKNQWSDPYFLTVGRLGLRKGLEDLIEAAALVTQSSPAGRFLIVGSGPIKGRLKRKVERMGLSERVKLLGHIADRPTLVKLYREATAYVHAAHYEGLPTVLLEAMACGTPAIATAVSGALDVISDGQNGLLVPAGSPRQLAQTALRLLADQPLSRRLGAAGRQTVIERFSWTSVSHNYARQYERLLGGTPA